MSKKNFLEVFGIILAVLVIFFGDNIFYQITGKNFFEAINVRVSLNEIGIGGLIVVICLFSIWIFNKSKIISLNTKSRIISAACRNDEIVHVSNFLFRGKNKSNRSIDKVSGFLQSRITNRVYPIYVNVDGNLVPPEKTNGIPPKGEFEIVIPFASDENGEINLNYGIELGAFLKETLDSTLTLKINKRTYKYRIPPRSIRKNIEVIRNDITPLAVPKVTRKE